MREENKVHAYLVRVRSE